MILDHYDYEINFDLTMRLIIKAKYNGKKSVLVGGAFKIWYVEDCLYILQERLL